MSTITSAFQTHIDRHPQQCPDLNDLLYHLHTEGRITDQELDAIQAYSVEGWRSFRAEAAAAAGVPVNTRPTHADVPGTMPLATDSQSGAQERTAERGAGR